MVEEDFPDALFCPFLFCSREMPITLKESM